MSSGIWRWERAIWMALLAAISLPCVLLAACRTTPAERQEIRQDTRIETRTEERMERRRDAVGEAIRD